MNIVFFGSSKYSTIDEKALFEAFGLALVVTLPDRLDTKTKQRTPNPVKQFALENNIPVVTAEKITADTIEKIASHTPDFLVVADYGILLPKTILDLAKKAAINVHHSLLPKYRGVAPVPFAMLAGEKIVGVTIMLMTAKMDAGDILAQEKYELKPDDTTDSVLTKLNQLGGALVVQVMQDFDAYYDKRQAQDESQARFTHFMTKRDGFIELNPKSEIRNPKQIQNKNVQNFSNLDIRNSNFPTLLDRAIRAYYPWPGVWFVTRIKNKAVRIKLLPNNMIQVEGKKPMTYKDFINGYTEGKPLLEKLGLA